MIKNIVEWFILIWSSLLVLLITSLIMFNYFNADTEILGAVIGFAGAIIGGSITLIGVMKTIQESRRLEFLKEASQDVSKMYIYINKLKILKEKLENNINAYEREIDCTSEIKGYELNKIVVSELKKMFYNTEDALNTFIKDNESNFELNLDCLDLFLNTQRNLIKEIEDGQSKIKLYELNNIFDFDSKDFSILDVASSLKNIYLILENYEISINYLVNQIKAEYKQLK